MSKQWSYKDLEAFGRIRLSENFYMREFLHSEIAQIYGLVNAPNNPDLAIEVGKQLCELILEPIKEAWGNVHVRSGYRSEAVNQLGNEKRLNCSSNDKNYAAHIWDVRDSKGFGGATSCIVIPQYQAYYEETGDWVSLACWLHKNLPNYSDMCFFKNQCTFNISWYEDESQPKSIRTFVSDPFTGDKKPLVSKGALSPSYEGQKFQEFVQNANNIMNG